MTKGVAERMVKSFLDLFVLSLLNDGAKHGYEVMRELKLRTGTRIGAGTLYPLLYELEERQLVSAEWMSPTRRSRRVYKITEKGSKYMEQGFRGINHLVRSPSTSSNPRVPS
jgi:PadR family transcriptional regulator PadR